MSRMRSLSLLGVCALAVAAPRWVPDRNESARARISIYRVASGKHLDFLKWQAARDEVATEAGVPVGQMYAHLDGDSWDYLLVGPITTPEQDKRFDEIAARKGLKTGFAASLEFRQFLNWHSDTFAAGPLKAADLVAAAAK